MYSYVLWLPSAPLEWRGFWGLLQSSHLLSHSGLLGHLAVAVGATRLVGAAFVAIVCNSGAAGAVGGGGVAKPPFLALSIHR
ncbi:hypothetical protein DPMN_177533 [Dreissena polymorpha]|uniref:Uncharacterized protein n=1 Tax=Dreissena polymorpha TaxID=45954 RepID=A0A9D4IK99_DREPO|nr:hypothetical protein DPMN_177533 [Dreissena polymorpha]